MHQIATLADATVSRPAQTRLIAPQIYYVHPLMAGPLADWDRHLGRAAKLGFTHVLTAPIFAGRSVLRPADLDQPHPSLCWNGDAASALRRIADVARTHGLTALLDVHPGGVAVGGRIATSRIDIFQTPDNSHVVDPRRFGIESDTATARWDDAGDDVARSGPTVWIFGGIPALLDFASFSARFRPIMPRRCCHASAPTRTR